MAFAMIHTVDLALICVLRDSDKRVIRVLCAIRANLRFKNKQSTHPTDNQIIDLKPIF